ncbi:hypothetical protein C0J45_18365 [Silurus meridionalis]|nr:hypothetical protein C0J45_18365 [Silurus meridionalis]
MAMMTSLLRADIMATGKEEEKKTERTTPQLDFGDKAGSPQWCQNSDLELIFIFRKRVKFIGAKSGSEIMLFPARNTCEESSLDTEDTYVRKLFVIPQQLVSKLSLLGLNTPLCKWILDFLTERPQLNIHHIEHKQRKYDDDDQRQKLKQRANVKFQVKLSKSATETFDIRRCCNESFKVFWGHVQGRTTLEDDGRSKSPSTSSTSENVKTVQQFVHDDRQRTIHMISLPLPHPTYTPDLTPADFALFTNVHQTP